MPNAPQVYGLPPYLPGSPQPAKPAPVPVMSTAALNWVQPPPKPKRAALPNPSQIVAPPTTPFLPPVVPPLPTPPAPGGQRQSPPPAPPPPGRNPTVPGSSVLPPFTGAPSPFSTVFNPSKWN